MNIEKVEAFKVGDKVFATEQDANNFIYQQKYDNALHSAMDEYHVYGEFRFQRVSDLTNALKKHGLKIVLDNDK